MELRKTRLENLVNDGLLSPRKTEMFLEFWNAMKTGVVNFSYIKKDGTRRFAMGTINPASIPSALEEDFSYFNAVFPLEQLKDDEISLFGNLNFPNTFHYIDIGSGEPSIRQFNIDTLIYPDEII